MVRSKQQGGKRKFVGRFLGQPKFGKYILQNTLFRRSILAQIAVLNHTFSGCIVLLWPFRSVQICASFVRFVSLCFSLCSVACQFYHLQNGHFASQNGHFASNLPCFGAAVLHLLPVFLCRINITSPLGELLFFIFGVQFAAFRPAFCSVLPCVLLHFTLRFAAFYLAFCCILHCVLRHFALRFAAFCLTFYCKSAIVLHRLCIYAVFNWSAHCCVQYPFLP